MLLPIHLTQLHLDGPNRAAGFQAVAIVEVRPLQSLASVEVCVLSGDVVPVPEIVRMIAGMPGLHKLVIDGASHVARRWRTDGPEDVNFKLPPLLHGKEAQALAGAISAAAQLKRLSVVGYNVPDCFIQGFGGVVGWGRHLQGLTALKELELGGWNILESRRWGAYELATLSQLTSLSLHSNAYGREGDSGWLHKLCGGLSGLQKLVLRECLFSPAPQVLGAVAKLTNLSVLDLDRNIMQPMFDPPELQSLLRPLVHLTQLRLPAEVPLALDGSCQVVEEELLGNLPCLVSVHIGKVNGQPDDLEGVGNSQACVLHI